LWAVDLFLFAMFVILASLVVSATIVAVLLAHYRPHPDAWQNWMLMAVATLSLEPEAVSASLLLMLLLLLF
jgi:hypothetical protein